MTAVKALLAEWNLESKQTRKVLERIPTDKLTWKPHAKSMAIGHLGYHLGWGTEIFANGILQQDTLPWTGMKQPDPTTTEEILAVWDAADAAVRSGLEALHDDALGKTWIFGTVEKPMMTLPRAVAIRGFLFSHLIHHRGQLSVYLRLLDVPVPGMYGPSADEQ